MKKSYFEVTAFVEVEHEKGVDRDILKGCIRKSFLLLPTIVKGAAESDVFSRKIGKLSVRQVKKENI